MLIFGKMIGFSKEGILERLKILKGRRTLKEFSKKLNIPVSTLHYYFNGRDPSLSFLLKVCEKLNVREEWLLLGKGPIYKTSSIDFNDEENFDMLLKFIKMKWEAFSEKEKNWLEISLQKMFPDYFEWLRKNQIS